MPLWENSNLSQITLVLVHQEEERSVIGRNLILRTWGDEGVDLLRVDEHTDASWLLVSFN